MVHTRTRAASRPPILVTGAPRTGTTWVGQMLARSSAVGYINEPFNPTHQPGIFPCMFPYWYQYLKDEGAAGCARSLAAMLDFRYNLAAQLRRRPRRAGLEALARDGWAFAIARVRGARPLVKDPIAVFSSDWFSRMYEADVVFMVRHPAAFTASVKRLEWRFPFGDLLAQEELIRDHLSDFEAEIVTTARNPDPVEHAVLMWRIVYTVARAFGKSHPEWIFLRQEDLALDPSKGFEQLFRRLGLDYTDRIDRDVRWFSSGRLEDESGAAEQDIRRNSADTVWRWRERLSSAERSRVRSGCEELASAFYADAEW
jgi:hypothetical protein